MECTINNCLINYETFGEGMPVLFLHGYRLNKDSLQIFFESNINTSVFNTFKRIYIDLPGMGKSTVSENIIDSADMLECLNNFIDNIIGNRKFLIVAQSYGGYLAQGLLKLRSEQIAGVFLICPLVKADFNERTLPVKSKHIISGYNEVPNNQNFEGFMDNNVKINPENWDRYNNEIIKGLIQGDHAFLDALEENGYKFKFEKELYKMVFDKPTYILLGKQDRIVGFADMLFFLKQFVDCNFHVINNAGHNIQIDQANLVIQIFNSFLDEIK
ncbi:TPA: alpha/beta hydrolase [Bacillus cereus]|nr:alpha/beta hydrolase [Bacillus cereus]